MKQRNNRIVTVISICLILLLCIVGCSETASTNQQSLLRPFSEKKSSYAFKYDNDKDVTDISILSAFVDVINKNATVEEVYSAFPTDMIENLSLHDFTVYLETINNSNLRVSEFHRLNNERKKEYSVEVTTDIPSLALEAESSEYYQLQFIDDNNQPSHTAIIAIQHAANGSPYLSNDWIQRTNEISQFSKLYFDAIEQRDAEMLSWLLAQGSTNTIEEKISSIEQNKADLLMQYYRVQIKTEPTQSIPNVILPNKISYQQELDTVEETNNYRTCTFRLKNKQISVSDPYPQQIKNQHMNIYYKDSLLFSWASNGIRQTFHSFMFDPILGAGRVSETSLQDENDKNAKFWRITYPQISFVIRGEGDVIKKTWSGIIDRLEITSNSKDIALGGPKGTEDSIYFGMDLNAFYRQYPFSPEADYVINGDLQGERAELTVQVDNTIVKNLILTVAPE